MMRHFSPLTLLCRIVKREESVFISWNIFHTNGGVLRME